MIKNECFMNMLLRLFKSFDKLEYYSDKATKLDVGQELYDEEHIKKILLANGSIKVSKRKIMKFLNYMFQNSLKSNLTVVNESLGTLSGNTCP
jgi:uncharacterized protein YjcR